MRVVTLGAHDNHYGRDYRKLPGDTYDHPSPGPLIRARLVAEDKPKKAKAPARPRRKKAAATRAAKPAAAPPSE